MSSETVADPDTAESEAGPEDTTLAAEIEVLREENRRLREEFAAARRTQYRRTALALAGVGLLAGVAGVLFANARPVLFALSGTGVFLGILIYYLTPEQFIAADVGERVYEALARNGRSMTAELGLQDEHVYVPAGDGVDSVRLFVPQQADYEVPEPSALAETFVVTDAATSRGVAFEPTGVSLAAEFERALTGELTADPAEAAAALTDALVEQFELVGSTSTDTDSEAGRLTIGVTDSTYGPIDRFDHPVVSFLAVGLAGALAEPVVPEVSEGDQRADYVITYRWQADAS